MMRTAISPRLAIRTLRMGWAAARSVLHRADRRLEERGVDDVLHGDGSLDEAVGLPPGHLLADVVDPDAGIPVLVGKTPAHDVGGAARVARGDGHDLLVVGPGLEATVLLGQGRVVVV